MPQIRECHVQIHAIRFGTVKKHFDFQKDDYNELTLTEREIFQWKIKNSL